MNYVLGLDVSKWQEIINYSYPILSGYKFVYIKATEAIGYTDPQYINNMTAAAKFGYYRGVYHFFRANKDPVSQANYYWSIVKDNNGELPLAIDVETMDDLDFWTVTKNLYKFIVQLQTLIKKAGFNKKIIIYTSSGFWINNVPSISSICDLWVANWDVELPRLAKGWTSAVIWQFHVSAAGEIQGIIKRVDEDKFLGTEEDLKNYSQAIPLPTPPIEETTKAQCITEMGVNVRISPATNKQVISNIRYKEIVQVLDEQTINGNVWLHVKKDNGTIGYAVRIYDGWQYMICI